MTDETSAALHTLEVFGSLRVEGAQLLGDDYELNENTEKVYLAGLGKLVYDPTLPSWSGDPKHVFLTMSDHLGSAAFVLDRDSGEVVEKITHQAYGEVESDYRPARWKSQREAYRFTGKEDDFEVGLTYFGARFFHTRLGRWASPDPLTIHAGAADPNPYAYVGGRVSTATDPHGLCSEDDASDCIGGAYWPETHQPWVSVGDDYWQPQFGDGGLIGHTYREWIAEGRPSWTSSPEPVGPEIGPLSTPASAIGTAGQAAGSAGGWVNTYSETPISNSRSDYLAEKHPRLANRIQGARNQDLLIEYAPWVLAAIPMVDAMPAVIEGLELGAIGGTLARRGGGGSFGPFIHGLNKGGLSEIITEQQLIARHAQGVAGGRSAVRAYTHSLDGLGPNPSTDFIEFTTRVAPTEANPGQASVSWGMDEGARLDIAISRIAHPDGSVPSSFRESQEMGTEELVWRTLQVAIPSGWEAQREGRVEGTPIEDILLLFPVECRELISLHEPCDAVSIAVFGDGDRDFAAVATTMMRQRIRPGEGETQATTYCGVPAIRYEWSNGVERVTSWFFSHRGTVYEVDLAEPWIRSVGPPAFSSVAMSLCMYGITLLEA